jgi:hypothetical protein
LKYLDYAREKGFDKAYILNQYDLDSESNAIINPEEKKEALSHIDQEVYTIQLKATQHPLNIKIIFKGLEKVNEFRATDGFYKYYFGEYSTQAKARDALLTIKKLGYDDAFVRNLYILLTQ